MASITLGGKPSNTIGNLPSVGAGAPNFIAITRELKSLSLDDLKGKKVILNIFPSIDTGVCATSVRTFNKRAAELANTTVVCMSLDLPFAQQRFCGAEGIEQVVVASGFRDGGAFGKDYGVQIVDGGFQGLYARAIVVINESGKVVHTELVPEVGQEPNYEAAISSL
jgi:thiol peroxidase